MNTKLETLERLLDAGRYRLQFDNVLQDSIFFATRQLIDLLVQQISERRAGDPQIPGDGTLSTAECAELERARDRSTRSLDAASFHALCKKHVEGESDDPAMAAELLKLFPGESASIAESEWLPRNTDCLIEMLEKMIAKENAK